MVREKHHARPKGKHASIPREVFISCRNNAAPTVLGAPPGICRRYTMSVKTLIVMFATVAASFAAPTIVQAAQEKPAVQAATPKPGKSGHAAVNGVNYYYAVYGRGEPLLLLHGGLGQIEMFGPNLTKLAQSRQVIGVDLQGHGRTALGNREISLVDMGNDMAGVLKKLGYDKVDVLGYSMGAGVAFQFAAQHPVMVRRLVL